MDYPFLFTFELNWPREQNSEHERD